MQCRSMLAAMMLLPLLTVGCSRNSSDVVRVTGASYDAKTQTLYVNATSAPETATGENILEMNDTHGVSNYASYAAPGKPVKQVTVTRNGHSQTKSVVSPQDPDGLSASTMAYAQGPVPGVQMDPSVHPLAGVNDSPQAKGNAVMNIAKGKIGTPYIWGHSEDRGQYGFDCSNFTAYVYHHALGYKMTGASKSQYTSVGTIIPRSNAKVGDLIIFERGKHVGIYAGGDRVLQEGGGLGKVGYISIGPHSYWGQHITDFKRMF